VGKIKRKKKIELRPEPPHEVEIEETLCLNCGNLSPGNYCNLCGQAADVERYSFGSFVREIYHNVRKVDITTTFVTSIELLKHPGYFLHDYLEGKRVGFIGPIKFFFYSLVADILVRQFLQWLTGDPSFAADTISDNRMQVVGLVSTILWGVFWRLFYWRSELTLAELAVCALFYEAQTNLLSTTTMILLAPFRANIPPTGGGVVLVELLIMVSYGFYFARQLFKESWWKIIIKQTVLLTLYLMLLTLALFGDLVIDIATKALTPK